MVNLMCLLGAVMFLWVYAPFKQWKGTDQWQLLGHFFLESAPYHLATNVLVVFFLTQAFYLQPRILIKSTYK